MLNGGLYRKLNLDILKDVDTHMELPCDPTETFQKQLRPLLTMGVHLGAITDKPANKLYVDNPVFPILHSFPKIHKEVFPPPVPPIMAGIGSLGEKLGNWIDNYLQPMVASLPGLIKDTKHLVTGI